MQRKILIFWILFLLVFPSIIPISLGSNFKNKDMNLKSSFIVNSGKVLYVGGNGPGNYTFIQDAINDSHDGDTIFVYDDLSPYFENISINKQIFLIGENKYTTIIDGRNTKDDGITINTENVTIQSLTIKDFRDDSIGSWAQAGIKIYSSNTTINNIRLIYNRIGIEVYCGAYNITIKNNELINDGILLGNYFKSQEFPDVTLRDFIHNIANNTINGRPLYYFTNINDFVIPNDAGQIILVNCSNVTIKDIRMSDNDFSIILAYCSNCLLENLTISDTDGEVLFFECSNNTIQNNTITNTFKAICLEIKSKNNIVRYNNVSENYVGLSIYADANNNSVYKNKAYNNENAGVEIISYHGGIQRDNNVSENLFYNNQIGIHLYQNSVNNTIQKNSIRDNKIGILLQDRSCNNKIIKNNIQKNLIPAVFLKCKNNKWDGNYWNRPRILPKLIFGLGLIGFPRINIDWHPALKPYDIEV